MCYVCMEALLFGATATRTALASFNAAMHHVHVTLWTRIGPAATLNDAVTLWTRIGPAATLNAIAKGRVAFTLSEEQEMEQPSGKLAICVLPAVGSISRGGFLGVPLRMAVIARVDGFRKDSPPSAPHNRHVNHWYAPIGDLSLREGNDLPSCLVDMCKSCCTCTLFHPLTAAAMP